MRQQMAAAMRSRRALRLWAIALASVGLLVVLTQAGPGRASSSASCAATGNETVATEHSSYQAGDTVAISGNGYAANCDVKIEVSKGAAKDDVSAKTADDGSLSSSYDLAADAADG